MSVRQSAHIMCGERRIRTFEAIQQRIYSPPQLATLASPQKTKKEGCIQQKKHPFAYTQANLRNLFITCKEIAWTVTT